MLSSRDSNQARFLDVCPAKSTLIFWSEVNRFAAINNLANLRQKEVIRLIYHSKLSLRKFHISVIIGVFYFGIITNFVFVFGKFHLVVHVSSPVSSV